MNRQRSLFADWLPAPGVVQLAHVAQGFVMLWESSHAGYFHVARYWLEGGGGSVDYLGRPVNLSALPMPVLFGFDLAGLAWEPTPYTPDELTPRGLVA